MAPDWTPGKQRGREMNVRMRLPIAFKLDKSTQAEPNENFNNYLTLNILIHSPERFKSSSMIDVFDSEGWKDHFDQ